MPQLMEDCKLYQIAGCNAWDLVEIASYESTASEEPSGADIVEESLRAASKLGLNSVRVWAHTSNPEVGPRALCMRCMGARFAFAQQLTFVFNSFALPDAVPNVAWRVQRKWAQSPGLGAALRVSPRAARHPQPGRQLEILEWCRPALRVVLRCRVRQDHDNALCSMLTGAQALQRAQCFVLHTRLVIQYLNKSSATLLRMPQMHRRW
eukprot:357528-Chlamydomonas_euryale.AAC.10